MFKLTTEWPGGMVSNVVLDTRKLAVLIYDTISLSSEAKILSSSTWNGWK